MSHLKGKMRALGVLPRYTIPAERHPRLQDLIKIDDMALEKIGENYKGVQGNALIVTSSKTGDNTKEKSQTQEKNGKPKTTMNTQPMKYLDCEKELLEEISSLRKIIGELRKNLRSKGQTITELQQLLEQQKKDGQHLLAVVEKEHNQTKIMLQKTRDVLSQTKQQLQQVEEDSAEKLKLIRSQLEARIASLTETKDKEVAVRDKKIQNLKQQMAVVLEGNSVERQKQLDELVKELASIQEEADVLRMKLRATKIKQSAPCHKCEEISNKLKKTLDVINQKDALIKELKTAVMKSEQLSQ